jgi:hypothetical protein
MYTAYTADIEQFDTLEQSQGSLFETVLSSQQ